MTLTNGKFLPNVKPLASTESMGSYSSTRIGTAATVGVTTWIRCSIGRRNFSREKKKFQKHFKIQKFNLQHHKKKSFPPFLSTLPRSILMSSVHQAILSTTSETVETARFAMPPEAASPELSNPNLLQSFLNRSFPNFQTSCPSPSYSERLLKLFTGRGVFYGALLEIKTKEAQQEAFHQPKTSFSKELNTAEL